jgi:hypothetical protein
MSTRSTSNVPANTASQIVKGGHANDEHAKAHAGSVFPVVAISGNAIEIWSDGAIWDTVANKFLRPEDVKRNG